MASRPAPGLWIREVERVELQRLTRSSSVLAGLAQRARIVLLAGQGLSNTAIAERVGVSRPTVIAWRGRYQGKGVVGLEDEPRPGRPRRVDRAKVIATTLRPPPKRYGVTHWSTRLLGKHLGIGDATVAVIWREAGIQPWRAASCDPGLEPAPAPDDTGQCVAPSRHDQHPKAAGPPATSTTATRRKVEV